VLRGDPDPGALSADGAGHGLERLLDEDLADAVVVGRPALANPDLARRWQEGADLNAPDYATFYTDGAAGYTDYPELAPVS